MLTLGDFGRTVRISALPSATVSVGAYVVPTADLVNSVNEYRAQNVHSIPNAA